MKSAISRNLRRNLRQDSQYSGRVIDILGDRCTLRLSENGATIHNIRIMGGPVIVGDRVRVDYSNAEPVALSMGKTWLSQADLDAALKRLQSDDSARDSFEWTILRFFDGTMCEAYEPSTTGFLEALSDTEDGGIVYLPDCAIEVPDGATVPEGVSLVGISSQESIIKGAITLESGSHLENLTVCHHDIEGDPVVAVTGPSTGDFTIELCNIWASQCYGGDATCISHTGTGTGTITKSQLSAESMDGATVGIYTTGTVYLYYSTVNATTQFDGSVSVYSYVEGQDVMAKCCVPTYSYPICGWKNSGTKHTGKEFADTTGLTGTTISGIMDTQFYNWNNVVRNGDYIYISSIDKSITEYNLVTGEKIVRSPTSAGYEPAATTWPIIFVVRDRTIGLMSGDDPDIDSWSLYEINFEVPYSRKLATIPTVISEGTGSPWMIHRFSPKSYGVITYNGKVYSVGFRVGEYYSTIAPYPSYIITGCYVWCHTDNMLVSDEFQYIKTDETVDVGCSQNIYTPGVTIGNKVISTVSVGGDASAYGRYQFVYVDFDIDFTTRLKQTEVGTKNWGIDAMCIAADRKHNKVYATMIYADESPGNDCIVEWDLDLDGMAITQADGVEYLLLSGKDGVYYVDDDLGTLCQAWDNTSICSISPASLCTVMDDISQCVHNLVGNVSDGFDLITTYIPSLTTRTFASVVPSLPPTASNPRPYIHHMGDCLVVEMTYKKPVAPFMHTDWYIIK